tara:strand:+ start:1554 stop:1904 length:351 start_codon:yes stop_codon:yes gene_type:complete
MIEYKSKAKEANIFLSENDVNFPIHHYMFVDPNNFSVVTLEDIIKTYQRYIYQKYNKSINYILDSTIPAYLNIYSKMKLSDYIKIKNTYDYHLLQGKYYYIPIIKSNNIQNDFILV